jgi:putative ABC transport system permease protein
VFHRRIGGRKRPEVHVAFHVAFHVEEKNSQRPGGIGIMNIMLVSVTECTREIGVRKALGATRRSVLVQFLLEAVVLCLAGGAVGVAAGAIAAIVMRQSFGWNMQIEPAAIGLAFAFAALVGIVFGVWPARRAASLDPIEALRYE